MTNPLIEKWAEIHNPPKPEPQKPEPYKPRYSNLGYKEQNLIRMLKELITDIENGKVFYENHEIQRDWNRIDNTKLYWDDDYESSIDSPTSMMYDRGQMINIKVFKRYD